MTPWMRRLALVLAALLVLAVAAAALLLARFDGPRLQALAVDWMRVHHGRTLAFAAPPELALWPRVAIAVRGVTLSEAGRAERFASVDEARLAVEVLPLLRGALRIGRIEARGVQLALRRDAQGRRNVDDLLAGPAAPASPAASATPAAPPRAIAIDAVALADVRLQLDDERAGLHGLLSLRELSTGRLADGVATPLRLALAATLRRPALQAGLEGGATLTPRFTSGGMTLEGLSLRADLAAPRQRPLALTLHGKAGATAQAADWVLNGELNGQSFETDGRAALGGTVPQLQAQARFAALDLDALRPATPAASGPSGGAPPASQPRSPADTPVDLSLLKAFDGTLALRAGTLSMRPLRLADVQLEARLAGGVLRVAPLKARGWGGTIEATLGADAQRQALALQATASGIEVGALLRELAGREPLDGRGRLVLDLASGGRSVAQLRGALAGRAELELRDGAVRGFDLARRLREAKALLSRRVDAVERAAQAEKTDFSTLRVSFRLDHGIARSDDLDLRSPFLRVGGDGSLDLVRGTVDYTARASLVASAAGQGGEELGALKGLTVPVRLTGPFEAVEWRIPWSALATDALKERAGQALPSIRQQLKDQLLKGLKK